ncbi:MAG: hypothetical protein MUF84_03775 [Anaerolineae bacterium]|jgi:hypothetical protein|nr:hypothetical protein [Anaerolineae bacterium]
MGAESVISQRYEETYASVYEYLQARRRDDPRFTIAQLRDFLKEATIRQGNDWIGGGLLFDATQAAIVAAHEAVLAEWQAEVGNAARAS